MTHPLLPQLLTDEALASIVAEVTRATQVARARIDGTDAHKGGHAVGDCPHDHGTPEGNAWRRGWVEAEKVARTTSGRMQADTDAMRALASRDAESYPPELRMLLAEVEEARNTSYVVEFEDGEVVSYGYSAPTGTWRDLRMTCEPRPPSRFTGRWWFGTTVEP